MRITIAMFLAPILAIAAEGDSAGIRRRVEKSLNLLQSSGVQFVKKSGCISCHHQSLPGMAVALARQKGVAVNGEIARQQTRATAGLFSPHRENLLQAINTVPASPVVASYALVHMAAENYPADKLTDAIIHDLAQKQRADGSWIAGDRRPPLGNSDVTATALSLRSLDLYGAEGRKPEFAGRIARARRWLASKEPDTSEQMTFQLMGLHWAKAPRADIDKSMRRLLAAQRPDGGWAQLPTLSSDAYATGQALVALGQASGILVTDAAYQRGVAYLLKNQQEDGSWHVRSRAMGFQPYFESGFPHGHDQWISAAATSWATMALTLTL